MDNTSYNNYLSFITDNNNKEKAREEFKCMWEPYLGKPTQDQLDDILLKDFLEEEREKAYIKEEKEGISHRYDIDHCVLLDFPLAVIAPILEKFVSSPYNYTFSGDEQIVKLIYNLWPQYMNQNWKNYDQTYPHNKIFNSLQDIKEALLEFKKLDTQEKLHEKCKEKKTMLLQLAPFGFFPFAW